MTIAWQGVTEDATGDLLRAGYSPFAAGAGETVRTDLPNPAKTRKAGATGNFHRRTGASTYIEIAQPAAGDLELILKLPTSDPGKVNQLWNDGGTVKISAG